MRTFVLTGLLTMIGPAQGRVSTAGYTPAAAAMSRTLDEASVDATVAVAVRADA